MTSIYYNPFQSFDLRIPNSLHDQVNALCQTQGRRQSSDRAPFARQVDIWYLGVIIGARRETISDSPPSNVFVSGEILSRDPDRIEMLELLAISWTKDPWVITKPREIVDLANKLAASGIPEILTMAAGNAAPIWNLSDRLLDKLTPSGDSVQIP